MDHTSLCHIPIAWKHNQNLGLHVVEEEGVEQRHTENQGEQEDMESSRSV